MLYSTEIIDKIYSYKSISNRDKIDRLLMIDATQYTNCGLDTTKAEKLLVKKNSRYIYKVIKKIDEELGITLLQHQDK
tara:strand:+ start:1680 stop:1913 length:234 start_codon:yes stop_codon:yes gene_type:complete